MRFLRPGFTRALLGLLLVPAGVQAADRDLYVSSSETHSIKRYDGETGAYLGDFVTAGSGGLQQPQECLFGADGNMYVCGFQNAAILKYDGTTGAFLGAFTSGYSLRLPTKMTYGPDGYLYVSQWAGSERVVRFDAETGAFIDEFTSTGVINGCGQAWDPDGNLYVASWGSDGSDGGVHKFDAEGNFLGMFASAPLVRGPVNLWFDGGNLYVLDWTVGAVQQFNPSDGSTQGLTITTLSRAEGFVFGPNGDLFICDWSLNRVMRYSGSGGGDLGIFAQGGGMLRPNGITFGPDATVSVQTTSFSAIKNLFRPRPTRPQ